MVAVDRVAALCAATVALVTLTACGDVALDSPALTIPDQLAAPPASQSQQGSIVLHATRAGSSPSGTDSGGSPGSPAQPVLQFLGVDLASEEAVIASPANLNTTGKRNPSWQVRQLSLRPRRNVNARDPMDHWGHRQTGIITLPPMEAAAAESELTGFLDLLKDARGANPAWSAPDLRDEDTVTVLGQDMGVTFGRWSAGPADTLSIKFNLDHATKAMRNDPSFRAMLERAGKVWSYRIEDTWLAWEREAGELKATLIGNNGEDGKRIEVGPGGETSTGLVIYVTGFDESESAVGLGGPGPTIIRPGGWKPHNGKIGLKNSYVSEEGSNSSRLFSTMAHEIGHVLGSWQGWLGGDDRPGELTSYMDSRAGTWTGPNVVAVHGGPAPFQDENDPHRWRDKHSLKATRFDFGHSGVCDSLMAYCSDSAAEPTFLPAEIDFAFLADVGLSIRPETDRPETYGLAGWLDHAAFLVSVSRELDVSLADDPYYSLWGNRLNVLDTTDLLWAEAHVFGHTTATDPTRTLPNSGTARYSGNLLGVAVDQRGMPPVSGTASIQLDLSAMTGRASFSSLMMAYAGKWYRFGDGNLHYSLAIEDDGLRYTTPGISLAANFYGPEHEEIAGTLDDSRAGLIAGFGAGIDDRPIRSDLIAKADYVRGQSYVWNHSMFEEGWHAYRCGTGNNCESRSNGWEPESKEHVLSWTAGWGDQMSEDVVFDDGTISISRRYASDTDGGQGRYQADGYYGTMNHAAFGTGVHGYHDWDRDDGSVWDFRVMGTGVQGKISNSQPPGSLTWEGRLVGYQWGLGDSDPFVKGRARVTLGFHNDSVDVDIDFDRITSMDGQRTVAAFGFRDIKLGADGTFDDFDDGRVRGAFFGPAHEEVAGAFNKISNDMLGSFGAIKGN